MCYFFQDRRLSECEVWSFPTKLHTSENCTSFFSAGIRKKQVEEHKLKNIENQL